MKAYKGFDKDMKCRGFQYEDGQTYELPEGEKAELCERGFHACEAPIDCLRYYTPADSVYHEVELDGVTDETSDEDSKRVGSKIKIGARIDIARLCRLQFEYVKEHCTNENNAEEGKPATAGPYGAATAGFSGAATAGYRGAATAGSSGAATAGESGAATSRGSSSVGKNGLACARGNGVKVRGDLGAVLVVAVENDLNYDIKEWKAGVVDGDVLKPGIWYTVHDGEWVEVETDET